MFGGGIAATLILIFYPAVRSIDRYRTMFPIAMIHRPSRRAPSAKTATGGAAAGEFLRSQF
jgi:hypothetical protein